jgi:hypothetical protein
MVEIILHDAQFFQVDIALDFAQDVIVDDLALVQVKDCLAFRLEKF